MPSTPRQPHEEGSPDVDVSHQRSDRHAWEHLRAVGRGKPCPVCGYEPSKNPSKDPLAVAHARLQAVFDDPVLRDLEWGDPPGDATDAEIFFAECVRANATPLKQRQPSMSEEQRAALEADAARQWEEHFNELAKVLNPGMGAEREREVSEKEAEGRRLYRAARERGKSHGVALKAANKDGTKKGRWSRSRLYEHGKRWKSEWEAERPK